MGRIVETLGEHREKLRVQREKDDAATLNQWAATPEFS